MATILYVDDDPENLIVFSALCAGHFKTITAESGAEALSILQTREISVLLADQRMPQMTGVELAERAAADHPDVVRILITAYSDLTEAVDAINRGKVRGYLRKPWDPEELFAVLRESLATYAMRKRVRQLELHMLATERVYTIGVVTAGIAHEMRSPLRALADGIGVVRETLKEARDLALAGDGEKAGRLLDSLTPFLDAHATSTEAMEEICRGFEVSNYDIDPGEHCPMNEIVHTAARLVLASNSNNTQLLIETSPTPEVFGNKHRLGRILINLLINAFESVSSVPDPTVTLKLYVGEDTQAGRVCVDVIDNGPGIASRIQGKIFDAFYSTKDTSGTGLGLAISRRIAEEVGGSLTCESIEGEGACFTLCLRVYHEPNDS